MIERGHCGISPVNSKAWAIGTLRPSKRFDVRRVVWGRLMARAEKRPGEQIRRARIFVAAEQSR
jgi:hypothetical protein